MAYNNGQAITQGLCFVKRLLPSLTVAASTSTDLFGKAAADLQENITISKTVGVTGTLKYVTGYTGYSAETAEQSGHYLALNVTSTATNKTFEVKIIGDGSVTKTPDANGDVVFRLTDPRKQGISVKVTDTDTGRSRERVLNISELVFAPVVAGDAKKGKSKKK